MTEENEKEKQNIKVSIDTARTEALARENERLKMAQEAKLDSNKDVVTSDIGQSVKDALIQKYADKGHECPTLETKEDFENAVAILKDLPDKKPPVGTNWVNPDYNNGQQPNQQILDLSKKVYPSYEAMLEDLHDREAVFRGSPKGLEATRMLEAVTRKFFEAHKETNSPVPILQKPMPELINVKGLLTPKNPDDGDLQIWNKAYRRRKILERQERDSINVNDSRRDSNYRRRED